MEKGKSFVVLRATHTPKVICLCYTTQSRRRNPETAKIEWQSLFLRFPLFFSKKARRLRGELNRRCRAATAPQWINFYTPTSRDRTGVQSWHYHSLYLINKGREYQVWERFNYRRQIKTVWKPSSKDNKGAEMIKIERLSYFHQLLSNLQRLERLKDDATAATYFSNSCFISFD